MNSHTDRLEVLDSKRCHCATDVLENKDALRVAFSHDYLVIDISQSRHRAVSIHINEQLILATYSTRGGIRIKQRTGIAYLNYTPNILHLNTGIYDLETPGDFDMGAIIFIRHSYFKSLVDLQPSPVLRSENATSDNHTGYSLSSYVSERVARLIEPHHDHSLRYLHQKRDVLELLIASLSNQKNIDESALKPTDCERMHTVKNIIETRYAENLTITLLAREVGTNEQYLKVHFKQLFGNTIHRTLLACRMNNAKRLLMEADSRKISEVAELTGYKHATHFTTAFKKYFGYKPTRLR